jgi:hypothetical protein
MTRSRTVLSTLAGAAALVGCLLAAAPARAASMLFTQGLGFATGSRSLWGPGGSTASFGASDGVSLFIPPLGPTVGAGYSASASAGTVSATLNGALTASYQDGVSRGTTQIGVSFTGSSASVGSQLGARFDVTGFVHDIPFFGPWDFCLFCANYALDPSRSFTPVFGSQVTASDSFGVAGVGPDIGIASAQLTLNANQTIRFRPDALVGRLAWVHRESGLARSLPFSLSGLSVLDALLDRNGTWDFSFTGLDVTSTFSSTIGANLSIDLAAIGLEWTFPFANVPLLNTPSFDLDFAALGPVSAFSIVVPEPGTLLLLATGLAGLAVSGRRPRGR